MERKNTQQDIRRLGASAHFERKNNKGEDTAGDVENAGNEYTCTFVFSTDAALDDGVQVPSEAWDLERFKRNPVVFFNHMSWFSTPIAKCSNIAIQDGKLVGDITFPACDVDERGYKIGQMVKNGYLNSVSVGFRLREWKQEDQKDYRTAIRAELLEVSVVNIPMDSDAIATSRSQEESQFIDIIEGMRSMIEKAQKESVQRINEAIAKSLDEYFNKRDIAQNKELSKETPTPETPTPNLFGAILEKYKK